MPMKCSVCTHPNRAEIDAALVRNDANRRIATQYHLTESSLRRHKAGHLPQSLVKAHEAAQVAQADRLIDRVRRLCDRAERLESTAEQVLAECRQSKDTKNALDAIHAAAAAGRELGRHLTLFGQMTGELERKNAGVQVNIDGRGGQFALVLPFSQASQSPPAPGIEDGTERQSGG